MSKQRHLGFRLAICGLATLLVITCFGLMGCQSEQPTKDSNEPTLEVTDTPYNPADEPTFTEACYPFGWTTTDILDEQGNVSAPAFTAVKVVYVPGFSITPTNNGKPISPDVVASYKDNFPTLPSDSAAIICFDETVCSYPTKNLMLNAPDFISHAQFDAVYSYDAPSQCAGIDIEGLTHARVDGYADGTQYDAFLGHDEYAVPIAYTAALKLQQAANYVSERGYELLIWDIYRPYQASMFMSEKFSTAYNNNPDMQNSDGWNIGWYVAQQASDHNFASAIDVSLIRPDGTEVTMPSAYDAFDSSAHLTVAPMSVSDISEKTYKSDVLENEACLLLHRAMKKAGFTELASEWWHFTDSDAKASMYAIIGANGMNFVAMLPE